ncbi:hypothetical protein F1737_05970 [Methanoplanus sp. FWC-SCC4]|uniref:Uncharacterized protein n=1 Tax=Methanochimaera problematica TaxID=2609417 RepID=A0AA97I4F5_9EURY|nr:hypothetical protein [Methanoplanus sp. FWC-SCC4]WOF16291.1 hypothetical protein F1737_05970 [Methanoplanus sp. FWC-SCC4]
MVQTELNASPSSSRATIYQLWVAVEKCFEMDAENQKVIIEILGDVTIENKELIEVKALSASLTDNDIAFWKTLYNWTQNTFDINNYSLILHTTQEFGSTSTLSEWNKRDKNEKYDILKGIYEKSESGFTKKKKKDEKAKPSKVLLLQRLILNEIAEEELLRLLDRLYIAASSLEQKEYYERIKIRELKGIPQNRQNEFLNSLLGFVSKPSLKKKDMWEITYAEFKVYQESLNSMYCKESKFFPRINSHELNDEELRNYEDYPFIQKINDIQYPQVVRRAVIDYLSALITINQEFEKHSFPLDRLQIYLDDSLDVFHRKYEVHSYNCSNIIEDSKKFYNEITTREIPQMEEFYQTPHYFHNGLLHSEMNNPKKELKWRLDKNE